MAGFDTTSVSKMGMTRILPSSFDVERWSEQLNAQVHSVIICIETPVIGSVLFLQNGMFSGNWYTTVT